MILRKRLTMVHLVFLIVKKKIKLLQDIDKLENLEALDLIQKARIKWDIEGDENSKFFHGIIKSKRRTQAIAGILHDGDWITEPPLIKDVFLNYYKDKFQALDSQVIFTPIANSPILFHHYGDFLESHISLYEVKNAVWECGSNKAPGPDGANSSFFTLILKISNPLSVKYFRPISLIGTHYKIISKLLTNRLSKVIDKVVSKEQSAFILGPQILDAPSSLARSSSGLHCAMSNAVNSGLIRGIKLGSSGIVLSHLLYADKVIITTDWNPHDIDNIIQVLHVFYLASRLKIIIHKSNIFGIGVTNDEISSMASRTGCDAGCFTFTYLGLPIGANINLTSSLQILIDRFQKRLSSWKANLLSIGGRLTLIKVVLGSLGVQPCSPSKWRWRLLSSSNNMWVNIIKALHGQEVGLNNQGCSFNGTWSRIIGTSNFLHSKGIIPLNSFCFKVGCDNHVCFWKDILIGDSPLHTRYNRLYILDQDKDCLIIDRIVNGQWQWNWSRSDIGTRNTAYLNDLLFEISQIDINVDKDTCTWVLSNDGTFSVRSARRLID
nr:RNA-directed DNA polymerase, eukaryota, reverse transcriptase zinc-binding domain protein [Tanacetum cinerariifolium]